MEPLTGIQLYGAASCPYTAELRDHLDWTRVPYVEYDVDRDPAALARLLALTGGRASVPVLVEDGRIREVGWRGRSCVVG